MTSRKTQTNERYRKGWPFLALIVLVGLGFMTPFVLQATRDYRIAYVYQPTTCQVLDERMVTSSSTSRLGGNWYSSSSSHQEFRWSYVIGKTRYVAEGYDNHNGVMTDAQETGNLYPGIAVRCWYDPAKPEDSVLVQRFRAKFYLGALIPGLFVLMGGRFLQLALLPGGARSNKARRQPLSPLGIVKGLSVIIVALALVIILVLPRLTFGSITPSLLDEFLPYIILIGIEVFLIRHWLRAWHMWRKSSPPH